jgi:hypothetical protein
MASNAAALTHAEGIEDRLHRAWRKQRRFVHARGACYLLLWLVALVALDLLLDWLFLLPGEARVALLAVNVGVLGWVVWSRWWRHLEPFDEVRAALQVERRHPELQSLLVSYVQLHEEGLPPQMSPGLVRALRREAVDASRPIDFREIVSFAELKRIGILALACIVLFGGYSVNWSQHLEVLARRLLNPRADLRYPTRTQIAEVTGDVTLKQGQPVTLAAQAAGSIPESGTLYVKPGEASWERLVLPQGKPGQFSYRFPEVLDSFHYRVRLGDARSDTYQVRVVPPPRIVRARVRISPPEYTGREPQTLDRLNFEAPEGSTIAWELTADAPLARAVMVQGEEPGELVPLTPDPSGRILRHSTTADESFSYRFIWHEREHSYTYEDDVRYFAHVVPDLPPQVELTAPLEDQKATTRKTVTLRFHAADDYGLGDAWIVYTLADGNEKRLPIEDFRPGRARTETAWTIRETLPGIQEGDVLTFAVEVADRYAGEDGPHRSRSQPRRLYIVSIEEYRRYILEKRKRLRTEIEALHGQETDAATQVDDLIEEAEEPEEPNDAPPEP